MSACLTNLLELACFPGWWEYNNNYNVGIEWARVFIFSQLSRVVMQFPTVSGPSFAMGGG